MTGPRRQQFMVIFAGSSGHVVINPAYELYPSQGKPFKHLTQQKIMHPVICTKKPEEPFCKWQPKGVWAALHDSVATPSSYPCKY